MIRTAVLRLLLFAPLLMAALLAGGCSAGGSFPSQPAAGEGDPVVWITFLQLNDVYEITPVEGGRSGGLARVATVRRQLLQANPNTFTVLAGDLLSPSAMGTAGVDGERLDGRQMVASLNTMGLDYATFGNHEFDLKEGPFLRRLKESRFQWVSGNVSNPAGEALPDVLPHVSFTVRNPSGRTVRIGLLGATIQSNAPDYVKIADPQATLRAQAASLRPQVDILVALTHLSLEEDVRLAQSIPEIDLILGGHEHENYQLWRGGDFTPIFKADANARSVYIHDLRFDTGSRRLEIASRLLPVTDAIPEDPETAAVVRWWVERAFAGFRERGFEPEEVVADVPLTLDGRESSVRNQATELTRLIARAMVAAVPGAEVALYNSGSIRIDDELPPGPLRQYDVLRLLPFGGEVLQGEITGRLLRQVLDQGVANRGTGGYLQTDGVEQDPGGGWRIGGEAVADDRVYRLAINDYLAQGKERGLEFLSPAHPDFRIVSSHGDIRQAVIRYLRSQYGVAAPQPAAVSR